MAKRYARINWQNRPNVATPISATNLNKMDKGIDDIDNAIEEIYNKRVNNVVTTNPDTFLAGPVGKTLQDQITTLNNNLDMKANYKLLVIPADSSITLKLGDAATYLITSNLDSLNDYTSTVIAYVGISTNASLKPTLLFLKQAAYVTYTMSGTVIGDYNDITVTNTSTLYPIRLAVLSLSGHTFSVV